MRRRGGTRLWTTRNAVRRGTGGWIALGLAPLLCAYHDEAPVTAYSAATLQRWDVHAGPFRVGLGVAETVDLSTFPAFWLLKTPNLMVKWNFLGRPREEGLSVAGRLGLFTLKPQDFDEDLDKDLRVNLVPLAFTGTWRQGDWRYNLTLGYTYVGSNAKDLDTESVDVEGLAALSTASISPAIEWRLGRVFALVLEGHVMVYQQATAEASQTLELNEGRTKVELFQSGEAEVAPAPLGNATVSAFWAWETFHLRVGLGYGHYNVPLLDVYLADPTLVPELDLYWRF